MHLLRLLPLALLAACLDDCGCRDPRLPPPKSMEVFDPNRDLLPSEEALTRPTVVLIVLDTVRADHTSLCGYARPTTPTLDGLAQRKRRTSFTCDAWTSGTWTIPSHASFFTGVDVPTHGADRVDRPLDEDLPTLAEKMKAAGYQTMLVSANPTLSHRSGLHRGYDHVDVGVDLMELRGPALTAALRAAMLETSLDEPLFLTVNVLDAHDPYPPIPDRVDWLPVRPPLALSVHDVEQDEPFHRFVRQEMDRDEARALIDHATDTYDYGVFQADRGVERILGVLRENGWLQHGFRVVVTSDHGEFLGEHNLLRHGCYTWEPVTRVPVLVYDSTRTPPELPAGISATVVHDLVLTGELPATMEVPASFSHARKQDLRGCADMVSTHPSPSNKLVWKEGERFRLELSSDPLEIRPQPVKEGSPDLAHLDRLVEAHTAHLEAARAEEGDPKRLEELEALGYVE